MVSAPLRFSLPFAAGCLLLAIPPAANAEDKPATAPPTGELKLEKAPFRAAVERDAVLLPAESAEIKFWPEAYRDELQVVEVLPPGRAVKTGDVVLRLESRKIDAQIRQGEIELRAAEQRVKDAVGEQNVADADLQAELTKAEKDATQAQKRLKNWVDVERPMSAEEYKLGESRYKNSIEDQEEELRQLGKMYTEDELTEETEEIVLKRSRRDIDASKSSFDLMQRRRAFATEQQEPMQLESMTLDAAEHGRMLDKLRRGMAAARLAKTLDVERAKLELDRASDALERLKRDGELFTLRAPREGILLHGSADSADERRLKKGAPVPMFETILTVAAPGRLRARFTVPESDVLRLKAGMAASVKPVALPDRPLSGKLEPIEAFPATRGQENLWNGTVTLPECDPRLVPGMRAKVEVVMEELSDAIAVPTAAIFKKDGKSVCYVKGNDGKPEMRPVKTGSSNATQTVVTEGLAAGETLLLAEPGAGK